MMRQFAVICPVMAFLIVPTVAIFPAQAQNYMPADNYNGAGVVVNMDVIGVTAPARLVPAPAEAMPSARIRSEPLPPVQPLKRTVAEPLPVSKPALAAAVTPSRSQDRTWAQPLPEQKPPEQQAVIAPEPEPAAPRVTVPSADAPKTVAIAADPVTPAPALADPDKTEPGRQLLTTIKDASSPTVPEAGRTLPELLDPLNVKPKKPATPAQVLKPVEAPVKTASLAPVASTSALDEKIKDTRQNNADFTIYRVMFDANSDTLNPSETRVLDLLVKRLEADKTLTLQMAAFADGTPETAAQARRMSLMRALKLRGYLIEKNVAATRLDVRAMGMGSSEMNDKVTHGTKDADRVDLVLVR